MSILQTQVIAVTRTATRLDMCLDTAERFVALSPTQDTFFRDHNRLKLMIQNKFIQSLNTVYYLSEDDEDGIGGIAIYFDWNKHEHLCVTLGDDLDLSGVQQGETLQDIGQGLRAMGEYLRKIRAHYPGGFDTIWWSYDANALKQYGETEMNRILNHHLTPEQNAKNTRIWRKTKANMDAAKASGQTATKRPQSLLESMFMGWSK